MWSVSSPWVLGVAGLGAIGVLALHLLSVHRPPELLLPTARFVPETMARAVARQRTPTDLLLLLLRILAVLAAGAALSGLRWAPAGAREITLVVADRRLLADSIALRAHVTRSVAAGRVTRERTASVSDTAASGPREIELIWADGLQEPGRALPLAVERAARLMATRAGTERFALLVVAPASLHGTESWQAWRAAWPGAVQLLPEPRITWPDSLTPGEGAVWLPVRVTGGPPTDLLVSVFARLTPGISADQTSASSADTVVVQRDTTTAAGDIDSLDTTEPAASTDAGSPTVVLVQWPINGRPAGWPIRDVPDTASAVSAGGRALIAPFVRTVRAPALATNERAIAWWSDGEVAAIERMVSRGCVRTVAIVVPISSDVLLTPAAGGVLDAVRAPCGGRAMSWRLADSLVGFGAPDALAPAAAFRVSAALRMSPAARWLQPALLVLALLALAVEWWRRQAMRG